MLEGGTCHAARRVRSGTSADASVANEGIHSPVRFSVVAALASADQIEFRVLCDTE